MKVSRLLTEFLQSEKSGGILLILVTILSLCIANSAFGTDYIQFWESSPGGQHLEYWINEGLMTIFFLLIGLELEREIREGELSHVRNALLPVFAALGGMVVPAGIYLLMNTGKEAVSGAGIPMATDIAFALGILSLLGKRVPLSLKIFLTALAVIDDLGAILIIAFFYTSTLVLMNLFIALGIFVFLLLLNYFKVRHLIPYLAGGILMWYFMLHSGVHATITGVLLAFALPFGDGKESSPSFQLQHFLHKPVAFLILPLFAMANTCIPFRSGWQHDLIQASSAGIILGLVLGKPLGIWLFSRLAVLSGLGKLPADLNWKHILGAGFLGGIGFTMSIFITLLAFHDEQMITNSKIAILIASTLAGVAGYVFLRRTNR